MELEEDARFGFALGADGLLLGVGVGEEGHDGAVDAGGRLDDVGGVTLFRLLVEVGEGLAAGVGVGLEVEVGAVGDSLNLAPAPGVEVLDVVGGLGVMGELVGLVRGGVAGVRG